MKWDMRLKMARDTLHKQVFKSVFVIQMQDPRALKLEGHVIQF
jgi:hypothetical protein